MFEAIKQGMSDRALQESQLDAELALTKLRLANSTRDALQAEVESTHLMFLELAEKNKELQNYIHRLESMNVHDRKTINTLRENLTIANSLINGQHMALVQATGDVAQLLTIDPSAVAGRYKLAVIDSIRSDMEDNVFSSMDEKKWPTHWTEGTSLEKKLQFRMKQTIDFKRYVDIDGLSAKEASEKLKSETGMELATISNVYYWLDWNPHLLADVVPSNDIAAYQALDKLIIKAINIKSELIPSGMSLVSENGNLTQRADSSYGLMQEIGVSKSIGLHPFIQESKPQWNWTSQGRSIGWKIDKYQATAQGLGGYLSKEFGVDITADNVVKPIFNKEKINNTTRITRPSALQAVSM